VATSPRRTAVLPSSNTWIGFSAWIARDRDSNPAKSVLTAPGWLAGKSNPTASVQRMAG
jgi:hypothetical protein